MKAAIPDGDYARFIGDDDYIGEADHIHIGVVGFYYTEGLHVHRVVINEHQKLIQNKF